MMHKYFLLLIQFILISFKAYPVDRKLNNHHIEINKYITSFLKIADSKLLLQTNKSNSQIPNEEALKEICISEDIAEIDKAKALIHRYMKLYDLTMTDTGIISGDHSVYGKYDENSSKIRPILRDILDSPIATAYLFKTCEYFPSAYNAHTIEGQLPPKKVWDTPKGVREDNYKQSFFHDTQSWLNSFGLSIASYYYK